MGAVEQDIDRHADETSEADLPRERAEKLFKQERENLASELASGQALYANNARILDFDCVIDRLCDELRREHRAALLLCCGKPNLAAAQLDAIIDRAAQSLVDDFEQTFIESMENANDY
jgi:hypothetical protein